MKLHKIEITNFKCFKSFEIDFALKTTVLIGKNGAGKTTLINAIKYGLSFIFSKDKSVNDKFKSISTSAKGLNVLPFKRSDVSYNFKEQDYSYPISIKCEGSIVNKLLNWELVKETASGNLYSTKYKEAYWEFKFTNTHPILVTYSDSFPHIKSTIPKWASETLDSRYPIPRNFGYYQWETESACTEVWERRFINVWKEILNKRYSYDSRFYDLTEENIDKNYIKLNNERNELEYEKEVITHFLTSFSQPISEKDKDLDFIVDSVEVISRDKSDYILFRFKNGVERLFKDLPAGYRRLFSIVLDIAYRAYILQLRGNASISPPGKMPKDAVFGIVLIDEIELHLHPSLQQEAIQRFQRTFPNIQFIISTHSALVMSNVKEENDNKIYKLTHSKADEYDIEPIQLYGMDISQITEYALDTTPRAKEIDLQLENLFSLIDDEKYEDAKNELEKMKSVFGDNLPELAKAQTMLDFFDNDTDK
jgi:predicted ATP-binding protein involved in virulence